MKRVICCIAALGLVCQAAGCCRMCCWQNGGSWYNGQCYAPQQAAAPAAVAPYTVVPQSTTVPYTVPPQSTAPAVLPQTMPQAMVPQQTFIPVSPCACTCN